jgi:hypothetical protein
VALHAKSFCDAKSDLLTRRAAFALAPLPPPAAVSGAPPLCAPALAAGLAPAHRLPELSGQPSVVASRDRWSSLPAPPALVIRNGAVLRAAQQLLRVDSLAAVSLRNAAAPRGFPPLSASAMVSRVTTALLLALAASTEASTGGSAPQLAAAPRRMLTTSLGLIDGGDAAAPQDAARALATAEGEVAALLAAVPRRALAAAVSSRVATNATKSPLFVGVAANGTSFELDGHKFIAVGANQCASRNAARRDRSAGASRHAAESSVS